MLFLQHISTQRCFPPEAKAPVHFQPLFFNQQILPFFIIAAFLKFFLLDWRIGAEFTALLHFLGEVLPSVSICGGEG
jgi:hypothetical protein